MSLTYGYVGSTAVSKEVLEEINIDPKIIISFEDSYRDKISGFATYPEYGNRWHQVDSINSSKSKKILQTHNLDILLVMAWQEILDSEVLDIPERGCLGRHLSLLPKRRGRAPVAWTLIHNLDETGVTLFWLDEGVDTGDIVAQRSVSVGHEDEARDLHDKLTDATIDLMGDVLRAFNSGTFPREPQDDSQATYTHPRRPDMGLIDWEKSAARLYDFVRAQTHPYPGAFTYHSMDKVTVWHASIEHRTANQGQPGEVLSNRGENMWLIQTGSGTLQVEVENHESNHPITKESVLGCLP